MSLRWLFPACLLWIGAPAAVAAELQDRLPYAGGTTGPLVRGELLYSLHCLSCHSTNIHWRKETLVKDMSTLRAQVFRWQDISGLNWSDEDIGEVARYLSVVHYRDLPHR